MKKIKLLKGFAFAALVTAAVMLGNSCVKPKECKANITVYDTTGSVPQSGVTVKLYATVNGNTADLKAEAITDGEGKVSFTFKLPAIMDIDAQKPNCTIVPPSYNSSGQYVHGQYCHGKGIIKLEEGKTTDKSVNLKD
jgi:hypothetical protein